MTDPSEWWCGCGYINAIGVYRLSMESSQPVQLSNVLSDDYKYFESNHSQYPLDAAAVFGSVEDLRRALSVFRDAVRESEALVQPLSCEASLGESSEVSSEASSASLTLGAASEVSSVALASDVSSGASPVSLASDVSSDASPASLTSDASPISKASSETSVRPCMVEPAFLTSGVSSDEPFVSERVHALVAENLY
jgi:hypothetical protein